MPDLTPRSSEQITPALKAHLRAASLGQEPWPLFIWGSPGSGKTYGVLCLADRCVGPCEYWRLDRLVAILHRAKAGCYDDGWGTVGPEAIWLDWQRAQLAILDEIGLRSRPSEHEYETVQRAIDDRENRPLIVIGNKPLGDLEAIYDDRTASRLGAGTVVGLEGDRRVPF